METLEAAKILIKDGFDVMVYTSDDPIIAKQLEDIGCCAVMPLASLIGSGMGILEGQHLGCGERPEGIEKHGGSTGLSMMAGCTAVNRPISQHSAFRRPTIQ